MDSLLQSFVPTLPLVNGTPYTMELRHTNTSDDVNTFLIDLAWPNQTTKLSAERPRSQEDAHGSVKEIEPEKEEVDRNRNTFQIATIDNTNDGDDDDDDDDDDDNWNIRSDYEEKDHIYYMPPGTYRSYVLGSYKKDEDMKYEDMKVDDMKVEKRSNSNEDHPVQIQFEVVSLNELKDDGQDDRDDGDDADENWNIRSEYEEKDFVYEMPPGTYRSYELGYWKKDKVEDDRKNEGLTEKDGKQLYVQKVIGGHDEKEGTVYGYKSIDFYKERSGLETTSSSIGTKDSIDEYLDMTTPQGMANRPRVSKILNEKLPKRDLCRVCRNFHDAKNKGSKKSGVRLVKKLLSWRRKPHEQSCTKCGLAVDRRSFWGRIFGVGRKSGGTY